jgi:two-component system response regulator PrrA
VAGTRWRASPPARPDVVVLDVSMPTCRAPRSAGGCAAGGNEVPVVMLSALDEADDRISGLQAGADDYLVKPFVTAELELRLRALLRRRPPATGVLRVGDLVVDADTRTARRAVSNWS